jgi:hypothetical protein
MKIKLFIVGAALILTSAGTAQAQFPAGLGFSIARRYVGPQIRLASPAAYSGLLAANRMIPPQVKNNMNNQFMYRGGGSPWNAELNYWRSMPPEVRNNIVRQQQQGYQTHNHTGYVQPAPQVVYVPVPTPPAYMPTGARPNTVIPAPPVPGYSAGTTAPAAIPAPPPPSELPRIIRPN